MVQVDAVTVPVGLVRPALARLLDARVLTPHARLPGATVHPGLVALLDAPYAP